MKNSKVHKVCLSEDVSNTLHKSKLKMTRSLKRVSDNKSQLQTTPVFSKIVPNLLLSYIYFLNSSHTCYINIGYDVETFHLKIIIYKKGKLQKWSFSDWQCFYKNLEAIQNFFLTNGLNNTLEEYNKTSSDMSERKIIFNLSNSKNQKKLIFIEQEEKILLNSEEWKNIYDLATFLNSVILWCKIVWNEIEMYYNEYYKKCKLLQVFILPPEEFFLPLPSPYSYCNYSRLFSEIPVFCRTRLKNDLNTLTSNTNS